jgi:hypothetical protein
LGFIPKNQKHLESLLQVTRAWQRRQTGKQDQGNGQGGRSPESASVLLWVTAERHIEIDAAFCIWFCNGLVLLFAPEHFIF